MKEYRRNFKLSHLFALSAAFALGPISAFAQEIVPPTVYQDATLLDVNGDGRADVISIGPGYFAVYLQKADGKFEQSTARSLPAASLRVSKEIVQNGGYFSTFEFFTRPGKKGLPDVFYCLSQNSVNFTTQVRRTACPLYQLKRNSRLLFTGAKKSKVRIESLMHLTASVRPQFFRPDLADVNGDTIPDDVRLLDRTSTLRIAIKSANGATTSTKDVVLPSNILTVSPEIGGIDAASFRARTVSHNGSRGMFFTVHGYLSPGPRGFELLGFVRISQDGTLDPISAAFSGSPVGQAGLYEADSNGAPVGFGTSIDADGLDIRHLVHQNVSVYQLER